MFYGRELLAVCCHPDSSSGNKHCDSGDIIFLICYMTSRKHMVKELCEYMDGSPSW